MRLPRTLRSVIEIRMIEKTPRCSNKFFLLCSQHQQSPQKNQQQVPYQPSQHYYYPENHHQYPPTINNGPYQQYPGISAAANQPHQSHQHESQENSLPYQQNMQQLGASQHSLHPYNGGYGGPQLPPRPYPPQHQFNYAHHSQQSFNSNGKRNPDSESEIEWKPTEKEIVQLDQWFSRLDAEGRGYIGGAVAAGFLSNSNLSRETLRAIWGLVDSRNSGFIDLKQFYRTIRLVSLSCSPAYAGIPPSIHQYNSTAALTIPLPDMTSTSSKTASPAESPSTNKGAVVAGLGPGPGPGGNLLGMGALPTWQNNQTVQQGATNQNVNAVSQSPIDTSIKNSNDNQPMNEDTSKPMNAAGSGIDIIDDFEFSDFESAAVDTSQSIKVDAESSFMPGLSSHSREDVIVSETTSGHVTHPPAIDLDIDFDNLSAPSNPAVQSYAGPIVDSAISTGPSTTAAIITSAVSVNSSVGASANSRMSFFDDLIMGDMQQQQEDDKQEEDRQEETEEWNDFTGGNNEDSTEDIENPFEAFNTGEGEVAIKNSSQPVPLLSEITDGKPPSAAANTQFESHVLSPLSSSHAFDGFDYSPESSSNATHAVRNDVTAAPTPTPTPVTSSAFEDEDFGDFEEAETAQPIVSNVKLPLFSANFNFAPPPPVSSSNRDSRFDTMDLLSMDDPPIPMPDLPLFSSFQPNFPASNLAANSSASLLLSIGQNLSSGDTSAEVFSPSPSPAPSPAVTHTVATVSHSSSERSIRSAPLSISTLESLAATLIGRDYYEEAYCCLQKASLLKSIDRLNEEKTIAIDADDLEAAVSIKKNLIAQKASLAGLGDDFRWTAAAASQRPGESIADIVDLVCAIDPNKRDWAQQLLRLLPSMSSKRVQGQVQDIEDLVAKALSVKRSLRMAIALSTTHTKHSHYWLLLLNHVSSAVQNTSNIMDAFNRLSGADKESVLACERMKIFIAGSLQIAELGVWVSASCVECVVHEAVAERVVVQCHAFVKAAAAMWKGDSKVSME